MPQGKPGKQHQHLPPLAPGVARAQYDDEQQMIKTCQTHDVVEADWKVGGHVLCTPELRSGVCGVCCTGTEFRCTARSRYITGTEFRCTTFKFLPPGPGVFALSLFLFPNDRPLMEIRLGQSRFREVSGWKPIDFQRYKSGVCIQKAIHL